MTLVLNKSLGSSEPNSELDQSSQEKTNKKVLYISLLGNALEFYDLGLYGFFAPLIASLYFPSHDQFAILAASMGIFAAGFIMRPFGALIFGYIGDFWGRKITLTHTILLMALPTFVIGILPTYSQIGVIAPLILVFCRLLQGICTGGEYNNAAIYMLEHTVEEKRGLFSGFMTASAILGFFMASSLAVFISFRPEITWLWRVPFIIGACIGLLGYYLRRSNIPESPVFQKENRSFFNWSELRINAKALFSTICIGWMAGTLSLSLIGYIPSYLTSISQLTKTQASLVSNFGILNYMVLLPVMGLLADSYGAQRLMRWAAILTLALSYKAFNLLGSGILIQAFVGVTILAILAALFLGPMHAYMLSLFPVNFRCRGISVTFALGVGLLGGTAPLISTFLIEYSGLNEAPAFYFMCSAVAGIIATCINSKQALQPQDPRFPDRLAVIRVENQPC